ncbi:MAG: DUF424 family protein [Candidatus Odinarchaeum yellowstonii]|uniref:DUF424 family protein n=1 Tax=Odinarchaeota yellowstonii (strain LCB_4) TaxID=1841599 RepID=A0AAF0IBI0_ODILC|nr:MAG: DUF424 family protein [Candidatus Odinarchaeum yellowstonii]
MECYIKIFNLGRERMVAVCDKNLIGRVLKDGKLRIEVKESFYKGEIVSIEEALEEIKKATIANIIGNEIIREAIKSNLIHESVVLYISGVAHAQIVKV